MIFSSRTDAHGAYKVQGGFRISIIFFVHKYFKQMAPNNCPAPVGTKGVTVIRGKAKQGCG